ncbi:Uu.00g097250.m01.CDS01 [Anthostomella pinea]|uniref:Uu.00g097250.m01.CDS01 n=1 Tax=Anthostomella pinea TaxID=933095 RepID=A0AAI8VDD5_9PEZI|nr:Uu.00g097250.m01.CDS01 [Anthostomella pinea]
MPPHLVVADLGEDGAAGPCLPGNTTEDDAWSDSRAANGHRGADYNQLSGFRISMLLKDDGDLLIARLNGLSSEARMNLAQLTEQTDTFLDKIGKPLRHSEPETSCSRSTDQASSLKPNLEGPHHKCRLTRHKLHVPKLSVILEETPGSLFVFDGTTTPVLDWPQSPSEGQLTPQPKNTKCDVDNAQHRHLPQVPLFLEDENYTECVTQIQVKGSASGKPASSAHDSGIDVGSSSGFLVQRPVLPCELYSWGSCKETFDTDDQTNWINHVIEVHLQDRLPAKLDCWFCDTRHFRDSTSTTTGDRYWNFGERMHHIREHIVHDGGQTQSVKPDAYMVEHLRAHGLVDGQAYKKATEAQQAWKQGLSSSREVALHDRLMVLLGAIREVPSHERSNQVEQPDNISGLEVTERPKEPRKRTVSERGKDQSDDGDNDDEDEDDPGRHKRSKSGEEAAEKAHTLVCPYFANDPAIFYEGPLCVKRCWNIDRLRGHIWRNHIPEFQCTRCLETFTKKDKLEQHRRQSEGCPLMHRLSTERTVQEKLKDRKLTSGKTAHERWDKYYGILFPDIPQAKYPSPDFTDHREKFQCGPIERYSAIVEQTALEDLHTYVDSPVPMYEARSAAGVKEDIIQVLRGAIRKSKNIYINTQTPAPSAAERENLAERPIGVEDVFTSEWADVIVQGCSQNIMEDEIPADLYRAGPPDCPWLPDASEPSLAQDSGYWTRSSHECGTYGTTEEQLDDLEKILAPVDNHGVTDPKGFWHLEGDHDGVYDM